jgi:hypothetical protein
MTYKPVDMEDLALELEDSWYIGEEGRQPKSDFYLDLKCPPNSMS